MTHTQVNASGAGSRSHSFDDATIAGTDPDAADGIDGLLASRRVLVESFLEGETLASMHHVGRLQQEQGRLAEAEAQLSKAAPPGVHTRRHSSGGPSGLWAPAVWP